MRLYERALELLFPPRCALCGRVGVRGLCPKCESTLPLCRTPLHVRKGIGTCVAPLRYDGTREALLAYKFSGGRSRCAGFGEILAQCVSEQLGGEFDVVSFVPVSEKRRRERGYRPVGAAGAGGVPRLGCGAGAAFEKGQEQPRAVVALVARGAGEERGGRV